MSHPYGGDYEDNNGQEPDLKGMAENRREFEMEKKNMKNNNIDKYYKHILHKLVQKGKGEGLNRKERSDNAQEIFKKNKYQYDFKRDALKDPVYKSERRKEAKQYKKESGQGSASFRRYKQSALKKALKKHEK